MESVLVKDNFVFFSDESPRALGRLTLAGTIKNSGGIGARNLRVYGRYALVLLCAGQGYYLDSQGFKTTVCAGDAIFVFPEIPHSYGPRPSLAKGGSWDEIFVCFDGPIFDLWRQQELFNDRQPISRTNNLNTTAQKLISLLSGSRPTQESERLEQLTKFLSILASFTPSTTRLNTQPEWLERAKSALESNLHLDVGGEAVAHQAGLSYESFRKQFTRVMGVSPVRYRTQKRIEAAQLLIERGDMTQSAIARTLGFSDETHLSRRFREVTGISPREYRQQLRNKKPDST